MTTRSEIADWFDQGVKRRATHLIVVCDTFEHEDYPVFATGDAECLEKYKAYNGREMQRVMEVYDLRLEKEVQMKEHRAMYLPKA